MQFTSTRILLLLTAAVIVAATGVGLTLSGRPFGVGLQTIHKLVALAAVVGLGVLIFQVSRLTPLSGVTLGVVSAAALLAVLSFVSGGVVSAIEAAPLWVTQLHRFGTWVMLIASSLAAYLTLIRA